MKRFALLLLAVWQVLLDPASASDVKDLANQTRRKYDTSAEIENLRNEISFDLNGEAEDLKRLAADSNRMKTEAEKLRADPLQELGDVPLNPAPETSHICFEPNPLLTRIAAENAASVELTDPNFPLCPEALANCSFAHERKTGKEVRFVLANLRKVRSYGIQNDACASNRDQTISGYFTVRSKLFESKVLRSPGGRGGQYCDNLPSVVGYSYRGSWRKPDQSAALSSIAPAIESSLDREMASSAYCSLFAPAGSKCYSSGFDRSAPCVYRYEAGSVIFSRHCQDGDDGEVSDERVTAYRHKNMPYRLWAQAVCKRVPLSSRYYNSLKTRPEFTVTEETPSSYTCSLSSGTYQYYSCSSGELADLTPASTAQSNIASSRPPISDSYCVVERANGANSKMDTFRKACAGSACPLEPDERLITDCTEADATAQEFGRAAGELKTAQHFANSVSNLSDECNGNAECIGAKIRLFPGKDRKCRSWRYDQIPAINCCGDYRELCFELGKHKACPSSCPSESIEAIKAIDAKTALKVGEYKNKKCVGLGPTKICWDTEKYKAYCVFGSPLARIVADGGRRQIGFGFGGARDPDCRGFTMEEFLDIDFAKIDFEPFMKEIGLSREEIMEAIEQLKRNAR